MVRVGVFASCGGDHFSAYTFTEQPHCGPETRTIFTCP